MAASCSTPATKKKLIARLVQKQTQAATSLADSIARLAEPGFLETKSAYLLMDYLGNRGFAVETPWPHMPTAFGAVGGSGRPFIGLLAEYDALPDCGPRKGQWGHGCGHNLLGVATAVAAVAARDALQASGLRGSVTVWGCPAEELLAGKVYMARDGAFRSDDAILAWHPSTVNEVQRHGGAALDSIILEFFGRTAHGTNAEAGRSALDGVMLLDVAANYLREHVPENVRIHMCVPDGGKAPNVVPEHASAWYYIRGKDRAEVESIRKRLVACARGAALATGTRMRWRLLTGVYQRLRNDVLADRLLANLELFGPPRATPADVRNAKQLVGRAEFANRIKKDSTGPARASSDEDNVSWLVPLGAELKVACVARGTPGHHRDFAAQCVLPFAHRGMLRAAEVLAATVLDLCAEKILLRRARTEFNRRARGLTYDPLIAPGQKPPVAVGRELA